MDETENEELPERFFVLWSPSNDMSHRAPQKAFKSPHSGLKKCQNTVQKKEKLGAYRHAWRSPRRWDIKVADPESTGLTVRISF